jgi:hypothetical protein
MASAITMTTVEFILVLLAAGACISSFAFIAERMWHSKEKGPSVNVRKLNDRRHEAP